MIARLASKGEQAVQRLADLPGGTRALQAFNDLKARVDDLSKKVRGIDELEQRVAKLEKELAALKRARSRRPRTRRPARPARSPLAARDAQPERARDHLEAHGSRPGLLAVELDRDRGVARHRHHRAAQKLCLRVREVCPA